MARIASDARARAIDLVGYRVVRKLERGGVAFVAGELEYLAYEPSELPPREASEPKGRPWWASWVIGLSLVMLFWLYSAYAGAASPLIPGLWR